VRVSSILPLSYLLISTSKSKLRKPNGVDLGPQYKGSSISRNALVTAESGDDLFGSQSELEDPGGSGKAEPEEDEGQKGIDDDEEIDSDEAFESGDEEKFERYTFRGSRVSRQNDEEEASRDDEAVDSDASLDNAEMEDLNRAESDSGEQEKAGEEDSNDVDIDDEVEAVSGESDDTSMSDKFDEPKADDRAALLKMMAEEQKTVAASLSKAAKADVAKGKAIKHQRTTFDALLNGRIKLQNALIATNSMSASEIASSDDTDAVGAAENAALTLWNNISALRSSHQPPNAKKRPSLATDTTTSATLWSEMQSHDSTSLLNRRATLMKWSQKTNLAVALTRTNKFSQTPLQQPLTSILDQHLSGTNGEKLIQKTRIPRSCAPVQATARVTSDAEIYDDADFYTLLLRELVDQRMADSNAPVPNGTATTLPAFPSQRDFKIKKLVDTKASKGRKMRYTVHEKLQNFMAADDRGTWGKRQRGELFGSLLGRKAQMGENEEIGSEEDGEVDGEMEGVEGRLRLFG